MHHAKRSAITFLREAAAAFPFQLTHVLTVNRLATATLPTLLPSVLTMVSKSDFGWGHNRRRL